MKEQKPVIIWGVDIFHLTKEEGLDAVLSGNYGLATRLCDEGKILDKFLGQIVKLDGGICCKQELLTIMSKEDIRKAQNRINKKFSKFFASTKVLLGSTNPTNEMLQGSVFLLVDILVVNLVTGERYTLKSPIR